MSFYGLSVFFWRKRRRKDEEAEIPAYNRRLQNGRKGEMGIKCQVHGHESKHDNETSSAISFIQTDEYIIRSSDKQSFSE